MITAMLFLYSIPMVVGQSYSTGTIELSSSNGYSAEIDVEDNTVTLTLVGPDERWMGIGFGETCMIDGGDVVIFDGTTLSDRQFDGIGVPPEEDVNQDWSIVSNTEDGGERTVIATRELNTGNDNDYVFSATEEPITIVWALGFSNTIASHGGNRGATSSEFVLGIEDLFASEFRMVPNPSTDLVSITLPAKITSGAVTITDYTGKIVAFSTLDQLDQVLDVSSLQTGMYLLNFETQYGAITRKLTKI